MPRFAYLFRTVLLICFVALPFSIAGAVVGGPKWGLVGPATAILLCVTTAILAESIVLRFLGAREAKDNLPVGLDKSFERAVPECVGQFSVGSPRFAMIPIAFPNMLVVRGLLGRGTICLSQGLVAILSEEELRAVLHRCFAKSRERGIVLRSLCAVFAMMILSLAPASWVKVALTGRSLAARDTNRLSPHTAILFLMAFPVARFFMYLSQPAGSVVMDDFSEFSAMQKIERSLESCIPSGNPGAAFLYALDPWR